MADQFREVEAAFGRLKEKFGTGRISQREFIDSLKQLRIRDAAGRFWMIGAQSGKWYLYEGNDWVQAQPPSLSDRKAICIFCGYENDLEAETCARCGKQNAEAGSEDVCPRCGAKLEDPAGPCRECEPKAGEESRSGVAASLGKALAPGATDLVVWAFQPSSFFWFFGILGLFAGMLLGLLVGVTNFFPWLVSSLPGFLADIQGKLLGGLVFTVVGGLAGFGIAGPAGFLGAVVSNGVLSLVGGLRLRAVKTSPPREDDGRP